MPAIQPLIVRDERAQRIASMVQGARCIEHYDAALPKGMDARRFSHSLVTCIERVPALTECRWGDLWLAFLTAAHLGLSLDGARGLAYVLPFKTNEKSENGRWQKVMKPSFIMGYKGMIHLSRATGLVRKCKGVTVFEDDLFEYEEGTSEFIRHKPAPRPVIRGTDNYGNETVVFDDSKVTHAYAVVTLDNGEQQFRVMERNEIDAIKARSRAKNGPWKNDFAAMARKSPIRMLYNDVGFGDDSRIGRAVHLDNEAEAGIDQDFSAGIDPELITPPEQIEDAEIVDLPPEPTDEES